MLQKITDTIDTHKWLWYSILGALAFVFAAGGAYGILNLYFSPSSSAAEAAGQTISLDQARNAWLRAQGQLQEQYGGNIPPSVQKSTQDQVLEGLITDALISEHSEKLGYRVSDPELIAAIRDEPAFQVGGQYSPDAAKEALAASRLTIDQYKDEKRDDLRRVQLLGGIVSSEFVTPAEAARAQGLREEEREIQYAVIPASQYKSDAIACIHVGRLLYGKYTPEMNCRTRTIGVTTAAAVRPERGTLENAIPSTVPAADPSRTSQRNRSQSAPDAGRSTP